MTSPSEPRSPSLPGGGAPRIDFGGQVVVITGAAGGLGRADAEAIGERGVTVVAGELTAERLLAER